MSEETAYMDSDGKVMSLAALVRKEPDWAASRIAFMNLETERLRADIERLTRERDELREKVRQFERNKRLVEMLRLQDSSVRGDELDGHGALFGFKFSEGCSDGCVSIYLEDDEWWHEKMQFDKGWIDDLLRVVNMMRATVSGHD